VSQATQYQTLGFVRAQRSAACASLAVLALLLFGMTKAYLNKAEKDG